MIPSELQVRCCISSAVGRRERQWKGVSEGPTEDPVKNGACLTNVAHRRWAKGGVRRLGSVGVPSSPGTSSPGGLQCCVATLNLLFPVAETKTGYCIEPISRKKRPRRTRSRSMSLLLRFFSRKSRAPHRKLTITLERRIMETIETMEALWARETK